MTKPRLAKSPKAEAPPETQQETPETPANDNQPGISKAQAVREALADGLTKPGEIQEFIQKRHGMDIPKPMVSSYAAQQRARDAKKTGVSEPRTRKASSNGDDALELVEALKPLLTRFGKDKLTRWINVLG